MKVKDYIDMINKGTGNISVWFMDIEGRPMFNTMTGIFDDKRMELEEVEKMTINFDGRGVDICIKKTNKEYTTGAQLAELTKPLNELDLCLINHSNGLYAVCRRGIGNPLFYFNINERGEKYTGTVDFKIYNVGCYTGNQIKSSLQIVNNFMSGGIQHEKIF